MDSCIVLPCEAVTVNSSGNDEFSIAVEVDDIAEAFGLYKITVDGVGGGADAEIPAVLSELGWVLDGATNTFGLVREDGSKFRRWIGRYDDDEGTLVAELLLGEDALDALVCDG
jgi:hypothetical protein